MKIFALAALLASSGFAATIYTNGTFSGAGGSGLGDFEQADDFTLSSAYNVTGFTFWSMEAQGAFAGTTFWEIRNSVASLPGGTVLATGTTAPTRTAAGTALGLNVFQNDIALTLNNVAIGTYWLVLHNGSPAVTDPVDFYWAFSGTGGGAAAQEYDLTAPGPWLPNGFEKAFLISGDRFIEPPPPGEVPEPGTFVLFSAGLAAVWFGRRQKLAKQELNK